jgi:hypothetical protein
VKLRVLPPTLDEMKRVMRASQEALLELRISPSLLGPAIDVGISGITAKYLALTTERKQNVAPTDYFEPYLKNLLTILRGHSVDLFNEDLSEYGVEQDVIDDILERQKFEAQRYGNRAKTYEQLRHDMVLWHLVKDKRPLRPESPIDAEYWIVTADFRLLGFDAYKHPSASAGCSPRASYATRAAPVRPVRRNSSSTCKTLPGSRPAYRQMSAVLSPGLILLKCRNDLFFAVLLPRHVDSSWRYPQRALTAKLLQFRLSQLLGFASQAIL